MATRIVTSMLLRQSGLRAPLVGRRQLSNVVVHRSSTSSSPYSRRGTGIIIKKQQQQLQKHQPFSSPPPPSSSTTTTSSTKPESSNKDPPTLSNLILATALFGFVASVFLYSMNAVGRADGAEDPLAQLKAEAHEALHDAEQRKKLTPEEIQALESGMSMRGDGVVVEVAVAAPADIAAIEEEANLKVFRQQQQQGLEQKLKKPWWRFGF